MLNVQDEVSYIVEVQQYQERSTQTTQAFTSREQTRFSGLPKRCTFCRNSYPEASEPTRRKYKQSAQSTRLDSTCSLSVSNSICSHTGTIQRRLPASAINRGLQVLVSAGGLEEDGLVRERLFFCAWWGGGGMWRGDSIRKRVKVDRSF
jgi:hypothetical protein